MQLDLSTLKSFFIHCENVTKAADNLPLIITAPTFKTANNFARDEIKKLHDSLYIVKDPEYVDAQGVRRNCFTCTPLALDIADFLNDNSIEHEEVQTASEQIIESFLGLLIALNKFIKLKNTLPAKGFEKEKNILEESFTELANILGTIIKPLGNPIKDLLEKYIYEGPALNSLRKQMDKKFGNEPKTIRELLALDKNLDGSIRKKPVDKKALEEKAASQAKQKNRTKKSQAKQSRRQNLRK